MKDWDDLETIQAYHKVVKNVFPLYIYRPNGYTTEIDILLQIQLYSVFTNVLFIIFKSFH